MAGNKIPIICLPLAIVGIIDDLYNLSPVKDTLLNYNGFVLFYLSSFNALKIFNFPNYSFNLFISYYCGTAVINFANFMDGIDGLVEMFTVIFISAALINDIYPAIVSSSFWISYFKLVSI